MNIPCPTCGEPGPASDCFCRACGGDRTGSPTSESAEPRLRFPCASCGAAFEITASPTSLTCPFCDSPVVISAAEPATDELVPTRVLPFTHPPEAARGVLQEWLSQGGWLAPGDLQALAIPNKLQGVYLPCWAFSYRSQSRWSVQIGEDWSEEVEVSTPRPKRLRPWEWLDAPSDRARRGASSTRRRQRTEWHSLTGDFSKDFEGVLELAGSGIPDTEFQRLLPFDTSAALPAQPGYLAGWSQDEARQAKAEVGPRVEARLHAEVSRAVAAFLPGDRHQNLRVTTELTARPAHLTLIPVYIASYQYQGQVYRFLVNGQTLVSGGERPWSRRRALAWVLLLVAVLALTWAWQGSG